MIEEPPDFVGNILAKLINRQFENNTLTEDAIHWNMSVVLDTDYYPVSIIFDSAILVKPKAIDNPSLIFKVKFGTIIQLLERKISLLRSVLNGSVKVKGMFRHPRAGIRFYRLMNSILKG